jgi:hypothetical protein
MTSSFEKILRVGNQSRPSASAGGCPTVYGGGKNCFVGRPDAGLREHDSSYFTPDFDYGGMLRLNGGGGADGGEPDPAQITKRSAVKAAEKGAPMARTHSHTEKEKEAFRPRLTLARSPVQGEGSSPRIDLNAAAIQIAPRTHANGPARDGSGRVLPQGRGKDRSFVEEASPLVQQAAASASAEWEAPKERCAPALVLEGGGEARFEKIPRVILTRFDEGSVIRGDPAHDADESDSEEQRPSSADDADAPQRRKNRARIRGRPRPCLTPFKFGDPVPQMEAERGSQALGTRAQPLSGRLWQAPRKRLRLQEHEDKEDHGQPPSAGYLAKAKEELNHANRDEEQRRAEEEVAGLQRSLMTQTQTGSLGSLREAIEQACTGDELSAATLYQQVQSSLQAIALVASKSSNLKGTFVKALNDAVETIRAVLAYLIQRTSTEETRILQAQNDRLRAELTDLRSEVAQMRAEIRDQYKRQSPVPPPTTEKTLPTGSPHVGSSPPFNMDDVVRSMSAQVGLILDARLGALELEGRLLPAQTMRPLLAADRKQQAEQETSQTQKRAPVPKPPPDVAAKRGPPNLTEEPQKGRNKGKGNRKGKKSASRAGVEPVTDLPPVAPAQPLPPAPASLDKTWNVAAGGKKTKAAKSLLASQPQQMGQKPNRPKDRKLRPPRSSAVVLTLQPDAEEKGVTYANVLAKAKESINLKLLGISAVKFKRAATGARVLEVPGTASGEKADALAKELAEKLGSDIVRISRPVLCAELRLTQLDDSVSPGEVVSAVAKSGGCEESQIKAGEIRQDASGLGSIWLRCPVTAAKKVVEADRGRLQVGWVRAAVKLLDQRPMRCYKCLEKGHVRAQCTCDADRSNLCYRCGQPGHKAAGCSATPNCLVCANAGKKADHSLGSKACLPPGPKTVRRKAAPGSRPLSQPAQPSVSGSDGEEVQMITD